MISTDRKAPVAVIGAGSFGTAVSWMLRQSGYGVNLWCYDPADAQAINDTSHNPSFLSDCDLSGVCATSDVAKAVEGCQSVIIVTPSFAVVDAARGIADAISNETPVVILSKGIDLSGGKLLLDAVVEEIGNRDRVAVLSGPNHAEELSRGAYAGATVACSDEAVAEYFQNLISNDFFRVYVSNDPVGVSLCGASKNVIAIACGITRGAGFGDNAVSVLITRGLAEIVRLAEACGGKLSTCMGLAGVGDLNATCNSLHSRNGMYGEAFAREGISVEDYEKRRHMVVEGAHALEPLLALGHAKGVELPIMEMVKKLLNKEVTIEEAAAGLMGRELTKER